jgi:hypothetical protein
VTAFVLVPGGWHGPDSWDLVAAELTARGHTAVPVDLPATDPAAGAAAYAAAVQAAVPGPDTPSGARTPLLDQVEQRRSRPGGDVVLVAHSLAGLVAPLVRGVRHVVYLAAMLPEPGLSVDDRARAGDRMTRRGIGRGQTAAPDGSTSWDPDAAVEWLYPDSPPAVARAAAARLRPQQWRITAEPSPLTAWPAVPGTYVLCREDRIIDAAWARSAAARHGLDLVELPGDHCPFLSRPADLADLLTHV